MAETYTHITIVPSPTKHSLVTADYSTAIDTVSPSLGAMSLCGVKEVLARVYPPHLHLGLDTCRALTLCKRRAR